MHCPQEASYFSLLCGYAYSCFSDACHCPYLIKAEIQTSWLCMMDLRKLHGLHIVFICYAHTSLYAINLCHLC